MARLARFKIEGSECWYHVHARAAGHNGEYPLERPGCRRKLINILKHFSRAYMCKVAAFCVMGNHWHAVIHFDEKRELSREELEDRAAILYPDINGSKLLKNWNEEQWKRFAERIFDVSELMRNIQAAFARWYNRTFDRSGAFWGGRFKSTVLGDVRSVLDCMVYIELNPVRAGLVDRPENHEGSSLFIRSLGRASWMLALNCIFEGLSSKKAMAEYRGRIYWRGSEPGKEGDARIPAAIIKEEEARGFSNPGMFLKRARYFSEGVAIGAHGFVLEQLAKMRKAGHYQRRLHPIPQTGFDCFSLREQRSHARSHAHPGGT